MNYRAWVEAGARGYFLSVGVAVNATRLINPLDRRGGYFVRRDTHDPLQQERRALLHERDREDGEREERRGMRHDRAQARGEKQEKQEKREKREGEQAEGWILTHRVERPAEVVRRGWLRWETQGAVVANLEAGAITTATTDVAHTADDDGAGEHGAGVAERVRQPERGV